MSSASPGGHFLSDSFMVDNDLRCLEILKPLKYLEQNDLNSIAQTEDDSLLDFVIDVDDGFQSRLNKLKILRKGPISSKKIEDLEQSLVDVRKSDLLLVIKLRRINDLLQQFRPGHATQSLSSDTSNSFNESSSFLDESAELFANSPAGNRSTWASASTDSGGRRHSERTSLSESFQKLMDDIFNRNRHADNNASDEFVFLPDARTSVTEI